MTLKEAYEIILPSYGYSYEEYVLAARADLLSPKRKGRINDEVQALVKKGA